MAVGSVDGEADGGVTVLDPVLDGELLGAPVLGNPVAACVGGALLVVLAVGDALLDVPLAPGADPVPGPSNVPVSGSSSPAQPNAVAVAVSTTA